MPRCKCCKDKFIAKFFLQKYCMEKDECIKAFTDNHKATKEKTEARAWSKEKKERKEALMSHSEWLKLLQVVFNTFIRTRDAEENCISCQKPLIGDNPNKPKKFDAGHFRSVGSNPQLRFNELNTFGQCVHCNRDKHGNLLEYRKNLILKIGAEKVEYLENFNESTKLSIPEIKEKIKYYKEKTKQLKNETN